MSTVHRVLPDDPVVLARGWLALALEECATASSNALLLCEAWDELESTGRPGYALPVQVGVRTQRSLVARARRALRQAIPNASAATNDAVARAIVCLDRVDANLASTTDR